MVCFLWGDTANSAEGGVGWGGVGLGAGVDGRGGGGAVGGRR